MNEEWKFGRTISAIIIGLIIGCCSGLLFVSTLNYRVSQNPNQAAWTLPTQSATRTPLPPTNTPVPIDTVVVPTDTPEPTSTAVPTDTPEATETPEPTRTPAFSDAEKNYIESVSEIVTLYTAGFDKFSKLNTAASEDVTLILSDEWRIDVVIAIVGIQMLNGMVQELDAPPRFSTTHEYLLTTSYHYDTFASLYIEGLDNLDADKLQQSTDAMSLGNESFSNVTAEMSTVIQ